MNKTPFCTENENFLKRVLTWGERCANIYGNKAEVTASHLKQNAAGVNSLTGKVPVILFECGESWVSSYFLFCLKFFGGVFYQ